MVMSAGQLSFMRHTQGLFFPDTCTFEAPSTTRDAIGGETESWSDTYTGVPCRLSRGDTLLGMTIEGAQVVSGTAWKLTIAYDQEIDPRWRVLHEGVYYGISHIFQGQSWATATRVDLRLQE